MFINIFKLVWYHNLQTFPKAQTPQKHVCSTRVVPRCGIWAFVAIGVDLQEFSHSTRESNGWDSPWSDPIRLFLEGGTLGGKFGRRGGSIMVQWRYLMAGYLKGFFYYWRYTHFSLNHNYGRKGKKRLFPITRLVTTGESLSIKCLIYSLMRYQAWKW